MTYQDDALVLVRFIQENKGEIRDRISNRFPNSWGGYNARNKQVVRLLIEQSKLFYTKELGSFVRKVAEMPLTTDYSLFIREIVGLTIEDVVFDY